MTDRINRIRAILAASDAEVVPACVNVEVPLTIDMSDDFREAYVQGYRHALADVRAGRSRPPADPDSKQ